MIENERLQIINAIKRNTFSTDDSIVAKVDATMKQRPWPTLRDASKAAGIGYSSYRFINRLLTLKTKNLPDQQKEKVERALASIDKTRSTSKAQSMMNEIIKEFWPKTPTPRKQKRVDKKNNKRLDQTLIHIRESCETTRDMEIPKDLSPRAAKEAAATLAESTVLIGRLIGRLLGEGEE